MSRILIVEDNPTNMRFVVTVLKTAGHQTLQAEDAITGIQRAREALPDIIFMDIQLPGMDGLEASSLLNAVPGPAGAEHERQIAGFLYPEALATLEQAANNFKAIT